MSEAQDRSKQARTAAREGEGSTARAYIIVDMQISDSEQYRLARAQWVSATSFSNMVLIEGVSAPVF